MQGWWIYLPLLQRKMMSPKNTTEVTEVYRKFHRCPSRFRGHEWERKWQPTIAGVSPANALTPYMA